MTEPEVTLRDVWQQLCSMDQSLNERFDRIERHLAARDARLLTLDAPLAAVGANLSSALAPR